MFSEDSDIAKLEERNRRLAEQIDRLMRDRKHAEDQIEEGRARELQLSQDLEAAEHESRHLTDSVGQRMKVKKDSGERSRSSKKDAKIMRRVSSRRTGPRTVKKTVTEFRFTDDGEKEAVCGCLIM